MLTFYIIKGNGIMLRIIAFISIIKDKIVNDRINDFATSASYYFLLSFIPFLMGLLSLIQFLPVSQDNIIKLMMQIIPSQIVPIMDIILDDIFNNSNTTVTLITLITLLWAASRSFNVVVKGLKQIYGSPIKRNWIWQRIISFVYALIFMLIIVATLILLVFGRTIINFAETYLPYLSGINNVLKAIFHNKHLLVPGILTLLFSIIFSIISKSKLHFYKELPGAFFSAITWYLFSELFSLYLYFFPNLSYMYGSLTTFVFALIWVYFCIVFIFIGAEINWFLQHHIFQIFKNSKQ